jgi:hypothetical protein
MPLPHTASMIFFTIAQVLSHMVNMAGLRPVRSGSNHGQISLRAIRPRDRNRELPRRGGFSAPAIPQETI